MAVKPNILLEMALGVFALLAGSMIAARDGEPTQQTKSNAEQATKAGAAPDRERDKDAIRKSSRDFTLAFKKGDARAIAAFWTEHGEYYDDSGEVLRGRADIEEGFRRSLPGKAEWQARSRYSVDSFPVPRHGHRGRNSASHARRQSRTPYFHLVQRPS
jgi:hypothetical protein